MFLMLHQHFCRLFRLLSLVLSRAAKTADGTFGFRSVQAALPPDNTCRYFVCNYSSLSVRFFLSSFPTMIFLRGQIVTDDTTILNLFIQILRFAPEYTDQSTHTSWKFYSRIFCITEITFPDVCLVTRNSTFKAVSLLEPSVNINWESTGNEIAVRHDDLDKRTRFEK